MTVRFLLIQKDRHNMACFPQERLKLYLVLYSQCVCCNLVSSALLSDGARPANMERFIVLAQALYTSIQGLMTPSFNHSPVSCMKLHTQSNTSFVMASQFGDGSSCNWISCTVLLTGSSSLDAIQRMRRSWRWDGVLILLAEMVLMWAQNVVGYLMCYIYDTSLDLG